MLKSRHTGSTSLFYLLAKEKKKKAMSHFKKIYVGSIWTSSSRDSQNNLTNLQGWNQRKRIYVHRSIVVESTFLISENENYLMHVWYTALGFYSALGTFSPITLEKEKKPTWFMKSLHEICTFSLTNNLSLESCFL